MLFRSMVNIGSKPTVTNDNQKHIEVHIFNFNDNIYNYDITISFIDKLRDEIKFNNLEELKNQLVFDKKSSLERLKIA